MIKAGGAITIHLEGDRKNRPSKKCENQSIMSSSPPPLSLFFSFSLPALWLIFPLSAAAASSHSLLVIPHLFTALFLPPSECNLYLSVTLSITILPHCFVCVLLILGHHHYFLWFHSDTFYFCYYTHYNFSNASSGFFLSAFYLPKNLSIV